MTLIKNEQKLNSSIIFFESLNWLKITIDEGPKHREDFYKNFSILNKQDEYWKKAEKLIESNQAYACSCSRSQRDKFSEKGAYLGHCRSRNIKFEKGITALRIKCPTDTQYSGWQQSLNDFVIWTKEDTAAYQLISVVEDTRYNIEVIIRGSDLEDSSLAQLYLAKCLGGSHSAVFEKIKFLHHKLLLDPTYTGKKYSKSDNAHSLKNKILEGYSYDNFMMDFAKFKSSCGIEI